MKRTNANPQCWDLREEKREASLLAGTGLRRAGGSGTIPSRSLTEARSSGQCCLRKDLPYCPGNLQCLILWGLWPLREYDSAPQILDRDLCPLIAMAPRRCRNKHNSLHRVHGPALTYEAYSLPVTTKESSSAQAPCEHFLEGGLARGQQEQSGSEDGH